MGVELRLSLSGSCVTRAVMHGMFTACECVEMKTDCSLMSTINGG